MTSVRDFERLSRRNPGYDCCVRPCGKNGCGTRPGSSHGRHPEEWIYVLKGRELGLSLLIFTNIWPEFTPQFIKDEDRPPRGADLSLHVGFPIDREQLAARGEHPRDCTWVGVGKCWQGSTWSTSLGADEFVREHFVIADGFEQREPFWQQLERYYFDRAAEALRERVDTTYERCARCDGTGTVRILEKRS